MLLIMAQGKFMLSSCIDEEECTNGTLASALRGIDRATDRLCMVIEAMPDISDKGKSALEFMVTYYSADTKNSIVRSVGEKCKIRDFWTRDMAGHLLRHNPDIMEERVLDVRATMKVIKYMERMNHYSDKLELKYADEFMVQKYLRRVSIDNAMVSRAVQFL